MKFLTALALGLLLSLTTSVVMAQQVDLSITVTPASTSILPGNNITYSIKVTNHGPDAVTGGTTTFNFSNDLELQSVSSDFGTLNSASQSPTTLTNFTLLSNQTGSMTLVLKVKADALPGHVFFSQARVTSPQTDTNPSNNEASVTATVSAPPVPASADLSISSLGTPVQVGAGQTFTFSQNITNHGPDAASTTQFNLTLPPSTFFAGLTFPGGWACTTPEIGANGTIGCSTNSFSPATATFSISATIPANAKPGSLYSFSSTVTSLTSDPNTGNNTNIVSNTVPVVAAPIPTLTEWAMILLSVTLAGVAVISLDRRRNRA